MPKQTKKQDKKLKQLIERVSELEDENESLWMMLDEMHASDVKNFKKALKEAIAATMLSTALRGKAEIAEA